MFRNLPEFWVRLRDIFRRPQLETDLKEEVQAHFARQQSANRAAGMSDDEALRNARWQLGDEEQLKERCRDEWGFPGLQHLWRDFALAGRELARAPLFVTAFVGMLAISIAAVAVIADVAAQILHPRPSFPNAEGLVVVREANARTGKPELMSAAQFAEIAAGMKALGEIGAQHPEAMNLVVEGEAAGVRVACVTGGFFRVLGVNPVYGRTFTLAEHSSGADSIVVLSHEIWMKRFRGSPAALGQTVLLGGKARRVIGIMPPSLRSPIGFPAWEVFVPASERSLAGGEWWQTLVWTVGRLKPGVTVARAQAAIDQDESAGNRFRLSGRIPRVVPMRDLYGSARDRAIEILLAAGVMLFAMSGMASLNLVHHRITSRRPEIETRTALGGSARRIFQMLLIENGLLIGSAGLAAGVLSALFSSLLVRALSYWWDSAGPIFVRRSDEWALVALSTLMVFAAVGILPAWWATAEHRGRSRETKAIRIRAGWRVFSTAIQAALAVLLLIGAMMSSRALIRLLRAGVGFDPAWHFEISGQLPEPSYMGPAPMADYLALAERLRAEFDSWPGVESLALANRSPLGDQDKPCLVSIEGQAHPTEIACSFNRVSWEYFAVVGLRRIQGQDFAAAQQKGHEVVIINKALAQACFSGINPLGRYLRLSRWRGDDRDRRTPGTSESGEIIGVVTDVRDDGQHAEPQCYVPLGQGNQYDVQSLTVIMKLGGRPPIDFTTAVRQAAFGIAPSYVVTDAGLLEDRAAVSITLERTATVTLAVLSGVALLVAGIGLYSLQAGVMRQRRQEIGLRLALGATSRRIQLEMLSQGLRWIGAGIVIGLAVSWVTIWLLEILLFATSPRDPAVFVAAAGFVFAVGALASWLPANRASRASLMTVLRVEGR